jgi:hypothetical protein
MRSAWRTHAIATKLITLAGFENQVLTKHINVSKSILPLMDMLALVESISCDAVNETASSETLSSLLSLSSKQTDSVVSFVALYTAMKFTLGSDLVSNAKDE